MLVLVRVAGCCCIRARLGFESLVRFAHDQVHLAQHVGQYMIGFQLQMVGLELQLHMAVAQVVGGAQQVERGTMVNTVAHHQHGLRRGDHADERAIFAHQHITTAGCLAARQKYAQGATLAVGGVETAFLAYVPIEFDVRGALQQRRGQAAALQDEFVGGQHGGLGGEKHSVCQQSSRGANLDSAQVAVAQNHYALLDEFSCPLRAATVGPHPARGWQIG